MPFLQEKMGNSIVINEKVRIHQKKQRRRDSLLGV